MFSTFFLKQTSAGCKIVSVVEQPGLFGAGGGGGGIEGGGVTIA